MSRIGLLVAYVSCSLVRGCRSCTMLCIHNLHGRQGMFGYVHSEGILITQKKEFRVKAALGFRVNYVYSRITTFRLEVLRVRQVTFAWCP
jgi:hypothetical protein